MTDLGKLRDFADRHGLDLATEGHIGMFRPCSGFVGVDGQYVAFNPTCEYRRDELFPALAPNARQEWLPIRDLWCPEMDAPEGVDASDRGGDYFAVERYGKTEDALLGLAAWCDTIQERGDVVVLKYAHGESLGFLRDDAFHDAIVCGVTGRRLRGVSSVPKTVPKIVLEDGETYEQALWRYSEQARAALGIDA
jgi:hypothetical protein